MDTGRDGMGVPRATHEGRMAVLGVDVPCYVLADGRRIMARRGALDLVDMGAVAKDDVGSDDRLSLLLRDRRLRPFISEDLSSALGVPVRFAVGSEGRVMRGYEATTVVAFCHALSAASGAGVLAGLHVRIARRCLGLVSAFSYIGIIALIGEATGSRDDGEFGGLLALAGDQRDGLI